MEQNLWQPEHLSNQYAKLIPIKPEDFEALFTVASDPLIWEQHPNKDRYKREVFALFFEGAMLSKGAFLIKDINTNELMGSTRFYDYSEEESIVKIGYTFYARKYWGTPINRSVKVLMLNHAFQFVDTVHFQVGTCNIRSQKAMEKLGAIKTSTLQVAYHAELPTENFVYEITKAHWQGLISKEVGL